MQTERLKWKTYFSLRCYSPFIPLDVAKVSFNQLGAGNMDWGLRGMICCWEVMIDSEGITSMSVLGQGDGAGAWEHLQRLQTELEVKHRGWIEEEDKQALFPNPAKILWRLRWNAVSSVSSAVVRWGRSMRPGTSGKPPSVSEISEAVVEMRSLNKLSISENPDHLLHHSQQSSSQADPGNLS